MIGERFGRWTVVSRMENNSKNKRQWLCRCECGTEKVVIGASLKSGSSKSCGCLAKDTHVPRIKHGYCGTRVYRVWKNMKTRCLHTTGKRYHQYGGRGIKVCDSWMKFENFLSDMGDIPFDGAQLDRIDNNGGYEPTNCRWTTPSINCRNKRNNRLISFNGETLCMSDWADRMGVSFSVIKNRVKRNGTFTPMSRKYCEITDNPV